MKTLKKTSLLVFLLSFFYISAHAQSGGGFGIKGGLNYNSNGRYFKDAQAVFGDPFDNLGYNVGLFGKVNVGPVFLRPELGYTQINSEINSLRYRTQRLDAPVLVGLNIFSLISVFAGPSFHYTLKDELRNFDYEKWNSGYQFGVGLNLGSVGLDLRYERELNGQEVNIDQVFSGNGDLRYHQLMLNLSLKF